MTKNTLHGQPKKDDHWIAIVEDGDGKIHIFRKYIEDDQAFVREVDGWNAGTILAVYREEDIIQDTRL